MKEQPPDRAPRHQEAEDHHRAMARFGITVGHNAVYRYRRYVYERLGDALAYAAIDTARGTDTQRDETISPEDG